MRDRLPPSTIMPPPILGLRDLGSAAPALPSDVAVARLRNSQGTVVGIARFEETPRTGVKIRLSVHGCRPGARMATHVHMYGDIENQGTFKSKLGPHYDNPPGRHEHPHHTGDLGNVVASAGGVVEADKTTRKFSLAEVYGRSIVLHEHPDDFSRGKASGNAGAIQYAGVIVHCPRPRPGAAIF